MPPIRLFFGLILLGLPVVTYAAEGAAGFTTSGFGLCALAVFVVAYGLVIAEEMTELRKSIPVLIAAGIAWVIRGNMLAAALGTAAIGNPLSFPLIW